MVPSSITRSTLFAFGKNIVVLNRDISPWSRTMGCGRRPGSDESSSLPRSSCWGTLSVQSKQETGIDCEYRSHSHLPSLRGLSCPPYIVLVWFIWFLTPCFVLSFWCSHFITAFLRDIHCSVNTIVDPASVLPTALSYARTLTSNSPDSVQSTKEGLLFAQRAHVEGAVQMHALSAASRRLWRGKNIKVRFCMLLVPQYVW